MGVRPVLSPVPNFWSKVDRRGPDECWPWKKACDKDGYGKFNIGFRSRRQYQIRAHRFSWLIHFGDIPTGLCVLHHCDNPPCCNPAHLWLGTKADNSHDCVRKGRHYSGRHLSRISPDQRKEMIHRRRSGETLASLSKAFGISASRVHGLTNRKDPH